MKESQKENYFLSQPHQPFFVLAVVNSLLVMLFFALNYKGILNLQMQVLNFHVYSLIFMMFTNVFVGFLFTTFSRFTQAKSIEKTYYTKILYANISGSLLFLLGSLLNHWVLLAGMFTLFISQIFVLVTLQFLYKTGLMSDKEDSFWILTALYFGLFSHVLFIFLEFGLGSKVFTINIAFFIYLIFLTFSVAQRMIPFFSHSYEQKSRHFIKIIFTLFLLKTIFSSFDLIIAEIFIDALLALTLFKEFIDWKLPIFSSPPILWVLHLGLFWLPTAFLISALANIAQFALGINFQFLAIHLLAIGFVTTILIGFGTRVTLGHSGQAPHADGIATKIFLFIQIVVILRALYSINIAFGLGANFLFDISFSAWLLLFLVWGIRYAKVLIYGSKISQN